MSARPYRRWEALFDRFVDDALAERVDRAGLGANEYGYDRWGASAAAARRALPLLKFLYERYFRVETRGLENVPEGRVLLISNHSAQLAYDGMLIAAAMMLEAEPPRFVRTMIERFFAEPPFVNLFMTRMGQLIGLPSHARRLLTEEEAAVLVFPEGERGGGRVWRDRYRIMGFGQGFLRLALETNTPIVPIGFVGGEEMCASLSRMEPLARLFGLPYIPLTPTILPVPLPVKVLINFGKPIRLEGTGNEEDDTIRPMVQRVEHRVKALIDEGLDLRESVFG